MVKKLQTKFLKSQTKNTKIKLLIYLIKLFILSLPILIIINLSWFDLQNLYATIVSNILNFIKINNTLFTTISNNLIISPAIYINQNLIIVIDFACTGIRSFYLLFALLFSLSWNPKKQFKYLGIGAITLFLVNIFRITTVTLLVLYFNLPSLFENLLWTSMLNITVFIIIWFYLKT